MCGNRNVVASSLTHLPRRLLYSAIRCSSSSGNSSSSGSSGGGSSSSNVYLALLRV